MIYSIQSFHDLEFWFDSLSGLFSVLNKYRYEFLWENPCEIKERNILLSIIPLPFSQRFWGQEENVNMHCFK